MMFLLKMVNYSMSFPSLSTSFFFDEQVGGTILDHSYFLNFFVGPLLHALMMFLLKMVNYSVSFPSLSTSFFFDGQVGGTILDHSYFLNFLVGPLLHA
jgi:hypothetical protein